jgi:hypothetical protein
VVPLVKSASISDTAEQSQVFGFCSFAFATLPWRTVDVLAVGWGDMFKIVERPISALSWRATACHSSARILQKRGGARFGTDGLTIPQ